MTYDTTVSSYSSKGCSIQLTNVIDTVMLLDCSIHDLVSAARDTRREGMLVGGTNKKETVRYELDVTAKDSAVSK